MDTLLITNNWKRKIDVKTIKSTSSTIKIPAKLLERYENRIKQFGSQGKYFSHILNKYRILFHSGSLYCSGNMKNVYQKRGQNLIRVSFRPRNSDWLELRIVSQAHFVSMSAIFVYLIEIDSSDQGELFEKALQGVRPTSLLTRPTQFNQRFNQKSKIYSHSSRFGSSLYEISIHPRP
ncbi:MAG: DUF1564 domain-containing protein [Leptospira sp.]|nr:DUF1564 domain-containing protein [Leptospira sp.]